MRWGLQESHRMRSEVTPLTLLPNLTCVGHNPGQTPSGLTPGRLDGLGTLQGQAAEA